MIARQELATGADWGKITFEGGHVLIPPQYSPLSHEHQDLALAFSEGDEWLKPTRGAHGIRTKYTGFLPSGKRVIGKERVDKMARPSMAFQQGVYTSLERDAKKELFYATKIGAEIVPVINRHLGMYHAMPETLEVTVSSEKPLAAVHLESREIGKKTITLFEWVKGTPGSNVFEVYPDETIADHPYGVILGILRYIQTVAYEQALKRGILWTDLHPTKQSIVEESFDHDKNKNVLHLTLIDFEGCSPLKREGVEGSTQY